MWPWEHLAIGDLVVAGLVCAQEGRSPSGRAAIAVALGTQFPDVVDKPLAWVFGILPGGQSLAHSLLVAVPVALAVVLLDRARARRTNTADGRKSESDLSLGTAFGVGYLSHLPADIVSPALLGGDLSFEFLLWPVTPVSSPVADPFAHVGDLLGTFLAVLATPEGVLFASFEVILLVAALLRWYRDGTPGFPTGAARSSRRDSEFHRDS
jgi:hypothetical protein